MVDYFTKVAKAEPLQAQDAEIVATAFLNHWICHHGVLDSAHSDQGANFESCLFKELCKVFGIRKTRTTPGHPQGNGQVERTGCTLVNLFKAFTKEVQPEDWDVYLGWALLVYRASAHTSTGVSPFKMLTGREMRVPSDILLPRKKPAGDNAPQYVLRRQLKKAYARQKRSYDKQIRKSVFKEDDLVQWYRPIPPPGTHQKFYHAWSKEPYQIIKAPSSNELSHSECRDSYSASNSTS